MAIRKSKINIDTEERSDFDNMMNDIENEVEEQQAEEIAAGGSSSASVSGVTSKRILPFFRRYEPEAC